LEEVALRGVGGIGRGRGDSVRESSKREGERKRDKETEI